MARQTVATLAFACVRIWYLLRWADNVLSTDALAVVMVEHLAWWTCCYRLTLTFAGLRIEDPVSRTIFPG